MPKTSGHFTVYKTWLPFNTSECNNFEFFLTCCRMHRMLQWFRFHMMSIYLVHFTLNLDRSMTDRLLCYTCLSVVFEEGLWQKYWLFLFPFFTVVYHLIFLSKLMRNCNIQPPVSIIQISLLKTQLCDLHNPWDGDPKSRANMTGL